MKPENDPNYETRLRDKIRELMQKGGDYYPFEQSNFREFLANMDDKPSNELAISCILGLPRTIGFELIDHATKYWERLARTESEARLAEEYDSCGHCGGNGCSKCEDKGHDYD